MVLESTSATVNRMMYKVFKTSLENYKMVFSKQRKPIITENCRLQKEIASGHFTAKLSKLLITENEALCSSNLNLSLRLCPPLTVASILYLSI